MGGVARATNGYYIVKGNTLPLQPGMTFSDEPGIYIRGEFGVRLEDDMVITEDGAELHQTARLNLADSLIGLGRIDEAREEIEAVGTEVPNHPYADYLLSRLSGESPTS